MRGSIFLLGGLSLVLGGCVGGRKSVFVDVDSIVAQETVPPEHGVKLPSPPAAMPGMSFSIPAQPARVVRDSGDRISTSIAEIEKIQRDASHALNLRLRALYETEIARFARERLAKFESNRSAAYQTANDAIYEVFQAYGKKRGPLMASLAVIVGWPDPNPKSNGDPSKMGVIQKILFLKAKGLRAQIVDLDQKFSAELNERFAAAQAQSGKDLANAYAAVAAFREQLNKKADAEAAREVRATPKDLDIRLAGARTTVLPALPGRSVKISPGTPMPPPPQVPFMGIGNGTEDRKKLVEQELQSWLGLNHMALAKRGQGAPDVTEEFKAWRKILLSGGP
jgi:hypothetical protein